MSKKYQKIYKRLIETRKKRIIEPDILNRSGSGYIKHQIVPKCICGQLSYEDKDHVHLTYKEQYIAWKLLSKITPNNDKVIYSFNIIKGKAKNSKHYQKIKEYTINKTITLCSDRYPKIKESFIDANTKQIEYQLENGWVAIVEFDVKEDLFQDYVITFRTDIFGTSYDIFEYNHYVCYKANVKYVIDDFNIQVASKIKSHQYFDGRTEYMRKQIDLFHRISDRFLQYVW